MSGAPPLSPRLAAALVALRLRPGMRVIEIGCGPGALLRAMAAEVGPGGHVLGLDRSPRALAQARAGLAAEIALGRVSLLQAQAEDFALPPGTPPFDLAVALRVGVLDGRHPAALPAALACIARALRPGARLLVDGGRPLVGLALPA